jgi:nucleoside-diphosphate-sugar epimerase
LTAHRDFTKKSRSAQHAEFHFHNRRHWLHRIAAHSASAPTQSQRQSACAKRFGIETAKWRDGLTGEALQTDSYANEVRGSDTFVHLIGVPHPSPAKAKQFRDVDLVSIQVAIKAARDAGVRDFVYLSVAHPAPVMKEFIAVRSAGEQMIRESGINATFVRPWYVLGPGHLWPYAILPVYWILEKLPNTKESAERLGLVTIGQIVNALVWSVENPPSGVQIVDVPRIRKISSSTS